MSNVCLNHREEPICACGMNTMCSFCKQGQGHIPCKCSGQTLELVYDAEIIRLERDGFKWRELQAQASNEVLRLRSALDAIISKLRREGCTSRGCDQEIHTMQCPMEIALLLEQALQANLKNGV